MSRRLDEDDEPILPQRESRLREPRLNETRVNETRLNAEREMTLGTGAILAIFFGLVVLCGAFFGFGYKLGSSAGKAAGLPTAGEASDTLPAASPSTNFNAFKPSAGSPAVAPNGSTSTAPGIAVHPGNAPLQTPPPGAPAASTRVAAARSNADADTPAPVATSRVAPAAASALAPAPALPMPATSATGAFVVQIAAVSHSEDAELLVNALHAKGYAVAARSEAGDRLVHIQVGPFSNKKDADAMRQRLLSDGYNAFIK